MIVILLIPINFWFRFDISRRVGDIQKNKKQIFSYQNSLKNLSLLKNSLLKARTDKIFLETILPQSENLINFDRDLKTLARPLNLEVSFKSGSEVGGEETVPGHVNFSLIVSGALGNLLRFLESLEGRFRYIMSFSSYNITSVGEGKFNLNLDGKVFAQ